MKRFFKITITLSVSVLLRTELKATLPDTLPNIGTISRIRLQNGDILKGYILDATDSTVQFASKDGRKQIGQTQLIRVQSITRISQYEKKDISRFGAALVGIGVGAIVGFVAGVKDCNDDDCSFFEQLFEGNSVRDGLIGATLVGSVGLVLGIAFGGKHKTRISLNGNTQTFQKNKSRMSFY